MRPHRALHRRTPIQAFNARPKAFPTGYQIPPHYRLRHDRIDAAGVITLRYNSRLHHIGLSKHLRGTNVTVLIDDRDIRVLDQGPQPIRGRARLRGLPSPGSAGWSSGTASKERPRSSRVHGARTPSPTRLPQTTIDLIVELREIRASKGLDHGPHHRMAP